MGVPPHMNRWLLMAVFLLTGIGVSAPSVAQETQVALDEAGRVMEIDRSLARRAGLFLDDYPELRVVRLYRVDTDSYVLEINLERDGRTVRERVPMTAEEVRQLRARVSAQLAARAAAVALDQDGRFLLLGTTTLLGLGYYGWAVPVMLDMDDGRAILATYMITAAGSFVLPFLYTRDRPVTYGMANAGFWGATRGLAGGAYLAWLLDAEASDRTTAALGLAGSLGGGLAMYEWARRTDMSAGDAHVIGNYGDYGHAWALSAMLVAQPDPERVIAASALAGSAAGLVLGARRAPRLPYTWGDAEIQRGGFYLGMYNALAAWSMFAGDDPGDDAARALGALLIGGSVAGLHVSDRLLAGHDFTAGQGILVNLGAVAGGLLGAGIGVLVAGDDVDNPRVILGLSALGANAGFGLTYRALSDDARRNAERRPPPVEVGFNPAALFGLIGDERTGPRPVGAPVPLLSVRYRF
jgi:hypothetical protein